MLKGLRWWGMFIRMGSKRATVGFTIPDDNPDGCWLWTGSVDSNGYSQGFSRHLGRVEKGHRLLWAMLHGPAPHQRTGLELDHLCKNRRCVNPSHLELVTLKLNRARRNFDHLKRPIVHGSLSGYVNKGCRCDECKTRWSSYIRERRYQALARAALAEVTSFRGYYTH